MDNDFRKIPKLRPTSGTSNMTHMQIVTIRGKKYIIKKVKFINEAVHTQLARFESVYSDIRARFSIPHVLPNKVLVEVFFDNSLAKLFAKMRDTMIDCDDHAHKIVLDIILSLWILFKGNIIHNDLHGENIMLRDDGGPVIIDFDKSVIYPAKFGAFRNIFARFFPELIMKFKDRDEDYPNKYIFYIDIYTIFTIIIAAFSTAKDGRLRFLCDSLDLFRDEIIKKIELIFDKTIDITDEEIVDDYKRIYSQLLMDYNDFVARKLLFVPR